MVADLGQILLGIVVAVAGFIVVVLVCGVLLALLQRVLPSAPEEPQTPVSTSEPSESPASEEADPAISR